jgi:hypothetical protein
MWKIISSLFICLFLFASHSDGDSSTPVFLWQTDQLVIQGVLPQEWRSLSPKEVVVLNSAIPEDIKHQSGKIVSSYYFFSESSGMDLPHNPQIVVFLKSDEHVNQEMIQKTYAWLETNKNLLLGMLSEKVDQASIQNIEYKQKLPAILFQNSLLLNDRYFTGLSSIIFLKNNILTIVCLADEKEFTEYEPVFRSFLESVVIPPPLQHETVISGQSITSFTEIFALLDGKWQPLLGMFLIVAIYGWVFLTGRRKRV